MIYIGDFGSNDKAKLTAYPVSNFQDFCTKFLSTPYHGTKHGLYFLIGDEYKKLRRSNKNQLSAWLLVIDGDKSKTSKTSCINPKIIHDVLKSQDLNHFIYSSYSNSNTQTRWRLVVPCKTNFENHKPTIKTLFNLFKNTELKWSNESATWAIPWFLPSREDAEDNYFHTYCHFKGSDFKSVKAKISPTTNKIETTDTDQDVDEQVSNIVNGVSPLHKSINDYIHGAWKDGRTRAEVLATLQGLTVKWDLSDSKLNSYKQDLPRLIDARYKKVDINYLTLDQIHRDFSGLSCKMPDHILNPGGILTELMKMHYCNSFHYYPEIALLSSIVILGSCFGNRVMTETRLKTNLYFFVLAGTGLGKNSMFDTVSNFFNPAHLNEDGQGINIDAGIKAANFRNLLGATTLTSCSAVMAELDEYPIKLITLDEAGFIFKEMKRKGSHLESIPGLLNELFTASNRTIRKKYAKINKGADYEVKLPHLSILGASTINTFWENVDFDDIESGFIPRLIILEINKKAPRKKIMKFDCDSLRDIIYNRIKNYEVGKDNIIEKTKNAENYFYEWLDKIESKYKPNTYEYSIVTRLGEMAHKFALIHTLSLMKDKVNIESVKWATELGEFLINIKILKSNANIKKTKYETQVSKTFLKIKKYMVEHKINYIKKKELTRGPLRPFSTRDRKDIINTLEECGYIKKDEITIEGSQKKSTVFYLLA